MKSTSIFLSFLLTAYLLTPSLAHAGDGATILFREGHVAYIANGYAALVEEYKKLTTKQSSHSIVELKIESSPFLINLAEVVIICRDRCTSLEVMDPRSSRRNVSSGSN
jgi:hypothetical protein